MKRFRRPIRAIREPFGTAGLLVAIVALVFALVGGAYAANNIGASASKAAKQGKQGKPGKTGPAGPAGPAGLAGPKGDTGAAGSNGTNGTNGTSVTTSSISTSSATCNHNGGVEVKSASPAQNVCNGTTGFTEVLPEGKTETGGWVIDSFAENPAVTYTAISFPIPLEFGLDESHVFFLRPAWQAFCEAKPVEEEPEPGVVKHPRAECDSQRLPAEAKCSGSVASPTAEPGYLCVYASRMSYLKPSGSFGEQAIFKLSDSELAAYPGTDPVGAKVVLQPVNEGGEFPIGFAWGSWAVTAP